MEPRGLQIGNWIEDPNGHIRRVHDLRVYEPEDKVGYINGFWSRDVHPVPITEEWLLSVGYKLKSDDRLSKHWEMFIELGEDEYHRHEIVRYSENAMIREELSNGYTFYIDGVHFITCKYRHEVQNAYELLTGERI